MSTGKRCVWPMLLRSPNSSLPPGYDEQAGEAVIKVVNADTVPYKTRLVLDGAAKVNASGKVITLKADKATDENTLDEPEKIVPVEKAYSKFARKFSYTFEPLSVTVLRVKTTS